MLAFRKGKGFGSEKFFCCWLAKDFISIIRVELYLEAFQAPIMEHGLLYLV